MSLTAQGVSAPISHQLLEIELLLSLNLRALNFSKPVSYIYNPLDYAFDMHSNFVKRFCNTEKYVLFLGMNPGPWGMSQTGVPFGEVKVVKEWMQITGNVNKPEKEHPARQILGLACKRSEVSGRKFWGLFQNLCKDPESFFHHAFVYNYCPLAFMTDTGKNITPVEMKASERRAMNDICDEALRNVLKLLQVKLIVAIGRFAESRAKLAIANTDLSGVVNITSIPHPSPRNFSSKNWSEDTVKHLSELNLLHILGSKVDLVPSTTGVGLNVDEHS